MAGRGERVLVSCVDTMADNRGDALGMWVIIREMR